MQYIYNDGGREDAGYIGDARDCVVRAIAIATQLPYKKVYLDLRSNNTLYAESHRDRFAKKLQIKGSSSRDGIYRVVYEQYLESLGWKFVPTMTIGSGCKVHLKESELPKGRIVARVAKHLVTVIDGVIHDTYDPSRDETRCVYGYYIKQC